MAVVNSTDVRCAYCGKPRPSSFIHFPLLASVARDAGVKLKQPSSDYFHGSCGREVFGAIRALDFELVPSR